MNEGKIGKSLSVASERYIEKTAVRAAVQLIPCVGGALDTLFSGVGSDIQRARIMHLINNLSQRLDKVESVQIVDANEEFYDLALSIFEGAVRSRSEEKRERFASILINKVTKKSEWSESETAVRILSSLEDIHIQVLVLARSAPECTSPFDGLKVLALENKHSRSVGEVSPLSLSSHFSGHSVDSLRLICSELVAKGLLQDEGVGRLDTKTMEYFIATDLADWFLNWVSE